MKGNKYVQSFNEYQENSKVYDINEYYGGSIKDLMNPRVQILIDYLEDYKEKINKENSSVNQEDTRKIENMWEYIILNLDLDTISSSNRQGKRVRGDGENLSQRIKRSIKNF